MSDTSGDKTEKATHKRLEDARKKGQLPRSRELTTALVVLAVTAVVMVQGETVAQEGAALLAAYLRALPAALITPGGGLELAARFIGAVLLLMAPILITGFLAALIVPRC